VRRKRLVAKIVLFSPQNGDENGFRRQKTAFLAPNWRRDWVSSSKLSVFHLKMVTRKRLVAKKQHSPPQIGDEKAFRRQNSAFFTSNWRRDWVSSSKLSVFHLKTVTRTGLVSKIGHSPPQNGDETKRGKSSPLLLKSVK